MLSGSSLVYPALCLAPLTSETAAPEKDAKKGDKEEGGESGSEEDDVDEERKLAMEQAAMLNIAFDVWEEMDPEAREKLLVTDCFTDKYLPSCYILLQLGETPRG